MRKTLIALAVLGLSAGVAHAQTSITIYGVVDTGYIKETGRDARMGSNLDNRIGFRGSEELGAGVKATFELERRFDLNDGTRGNDSAVPRYQAPGSSGPDWGGPANVGLTGDFGSVRLGRVAELSTETIRKFDPFMQYGVGSMIYSTQRAEAIDNTLRYDSPRWGGFGFGLSYSLGKGKKPESANWTKPDMVGVDNDGWAVNVGFDGGPVAFTTNYSRLADSNSSHIWNVGLAYLFGPGKVSLLYENTKDKGYKLAEDSYVMDGLSSYGQQQLWLLGLEWCIGSGQLDASVQYFRLKDADPVFIKTDDGNSNSNWKYSLGYTYNLSKRTSAYGMASYTRYDFDEVGQYYHGINRKSVTGLQIGMTHKF